MIGAIYGDIAGSIYEWHNIKTKDFELLSNKCFFTDDTVMTLAVAKAIKECNGDYYNLRDKCVYYMKEIGRKYPHCGYGSHFKSWIYADQPQPYNSFGNGSAMRVSAAGWAANSIEEAIGLSKMVTDISHNHSEGIKGAEAVAVAIYLAKTGHGKDFIYKVILHNYYVIDFTLDMIRPTYKFDVTCQGSVPQALQAFFESNSFEDTIRNAISIGGDSDTIAAIAGSIAEAYYGVPPEFEMDASDFLDEELFPLYLEVSKYFNSLECNKDWVESHHKFNK